MAGGNKRGGAKDKEAVEAAGVKTRKGGGGRNLAGGLTRSGRPSQHAAPTAPAIGERAAAVSGTAAAADPEPDRADKPEEGAVPDKDPNPHGTGVEPTDPQVSSTPQAVAGVQEAAPRGPTDALPDTEPVEEGAGVDAEAGGPATTDPAESFATARSTLAGDEAGPGKTFAMTVRV